MADKKISQLTAATTPLAGTEVLPIVQGTTTVKVANNDLRPKQIQSNATSGVLQVTGPAAGSTRVMTTPDANFTVARTDAAQTLTGDQTVSTGNVLIDYGTGIKCRLSGNDIGYLLQEYYTGINNALQIGPAVGAGGYGETLLGYANNGTVAVGAKVDQFGNLNALVGNIIIGTSGKGIDFSATGDASGMTSELLSDYEEGTWTPVIAIDGTGSITATVSGSYTKIGRFVFCTFNINVDSVSSPNGSLYINGLPYAAKTGAAYGSVTINAFFGLVAGKTMLGGYVQSGSSGFVPTGTSGAQNSVDNPIPAGNMQVGSALIGTVTYIV